MATDAIVTKYHGPSNVRGARISVKLDGYPRKVYGYDHAASNPYARAAEDYANLHGLKGGWVEGAMPGNVRVFVKMQTETGIPYAPAFSPLKVA